MPSLTESELVAWGEQIGRALQPPAFIALRGDLGAGKSVLARAIARGAGVTAQMPSPTFNLLIRYPLVGDAAVVHVDLYRLDDPEEIWELGWEELPGERDVVLVEWPERAEALLPEDRAEVVLEEAGAGRRIATVSRVGDGPDLPSPHPLEAHG